MEFRSQQAIYQQVADHVCGMILKGTWKPGERMPSVRELAMEMEVNPNTVNKGFAYLQDRGLIHNERGIGYFINDQAPAQTRNIKRAEFFEETLPQVFHSMTLLDISIDEIEEKWKNHRRPQ